MPTLSSVMSLFTEQAIDKLIREELENDDTDTESNDNYAARYEPSAPQKMDANPEPVKTLPVVAPQATQEETTPGVIQAKGQLILDDQPTQDYNMEKVADDSMSIDDSELESDMEDDEEGMWSDESQAGSETHGKEGKCMKGTTEGQSLESAPQAQPNCSAAEPTVNTDPTAPTNTVPPTSSPQQPTVNVFVNHVYFVNPDCHCRSWPSVTWRPVVSHHPTFSYVFEQGNLLQQQHQDDRRNSV
uniref:Histone-lysine N-methyltransferase SETD1B n=1 Tax=Steinernema glaseri TaxID=37863 RepID=A0A1I7ZGL6_9BILA